MKSFVLITVLSYMAAQSCAFVSPGHRFHGVVQRPTPTAGSTSILDTTSSSPVAAYQQPASLQRQRKSVASVQTMVFGLGAPEVAIILVAAAFLLGPQKLAELGRDAGKIAGELKEVPKEFQQGLAEGEAQAKAMKTDTVTKIQAANNVEEKKAE